MLRDALITLSFDGVKIQSMLRHMKFNPQNFKLMKFIKVIVSQNGVVSYMALGSYMVNSTKPY